ncbi:MAG: FAD-binding protein [Desulfobacterales bacterium]|nr:MAG: FAD-binding protein [Desulfobacterales bacterium]
MARSDFIYTDFLIVGGGAAGCMAAVRARELEPEIDVVILEKAEISRSGAAGRGMDALNNVVVPGIATVADYVEAVEIVADGVFEPTISRVIGERSFGILQRLEAWGLHFPRNDRGNYIVNQFHPKGRFLVEMRGELKKILAAQAIGCGARIFNRHPVLELVKQDERIAGAIALNLDCGELKTFVAPAVLLAAGGAARIGLPSTGYLHGTFDCPWCNGEAHKLGYEAGASLTGFEYTASSSMTRDFNGPGLSTFIRHGAWLINGLGERFMERYDAERLERAPSGIRMQAMREEINAGRGPVAFSFSHLPVKTIQLIEDGIFEAERPTMRDYFQRKGIDLKQQPVEVVASEVYLCGGHGLAGLVGDGWGETGVPGLFAAGDCLANPYGFLPGAMAMGEATAERIVDRSPARPAFGDAAPRLARLRASVEGHRRGALGVAVRDFEYKFRRLVNEYVAPPKSARKLQRFLDETEAMTREQDDLPAADAHGLMKVFEAKAGLFCARMAARASLFRTESRFGLYHERVDYPLQDDQNWKTRVLISRGPDGPILTRENP